MLLKDFFRAFSALRALSTFRVLLKSSKVKNQLGKIGEYRVKQVKVKGQLRKISEYKVKQAKVIQKH